MARAWHSIAILALLLLAAPGALGFRDCYLSSQVCMDYDYRAGNTYAEVQSGSIIAGGGIYAGPAYKGYTLHFFSPGNYVSVYDGEWYGDDFTLVSIGIQNKEYVRYDQDSRKSEHPGYYHCYSVSNVVSRCGTGLP